MKNRPKKPNPVAADPKVRIPRDLLDEVGEEVRHWFALGGDFSQIKAVSIALRDWVRQRKEDRKYPGKAVRT